MCNLEGHLGIEIGGLILNNVTYADVTRLIEKKKKKKKKN